MKKLFFLFSIAPAISFAQQHEVNLFLLDRNTINFKQSQTDPMTAASMEVTQKEGRIRYALGYNFINKKDVELGVAVGFGINKSDAVQLESDPTYQSSLTYTAKQRWMYVAPSIGQRFHWDKLLLHLNVSLPVSRTTYSDYRQTVDEISSVSGADPHTGVAVFEAPSILTFGVSANTMVSYPIVKKLYLSAGIGLAQTWTRSQGLLNVDVQEMYMGSSYNDNYNIDYRNNSSVFSVKPYLGLRLVF